MDDNYHSILSNMISFPLRKQVHINFDLKRKIFKLSMPIYSTKGDVSKSVAQYVDARRNHSFKPFVTAFQLEGKRVILIQEIPFNWGFQPGIREQVTRFWQMGKKLHKMLGEIALEEKYRDALYLQAEILD